MRVEAKEVALSRSTHRKPARKKHRNVHTMRFHARVCKRTEQTHRLLREDGPFREALHKEAVLLLLGIKITKSQYIIFATIAVVHTRIRSHSRSLDMVLDFGAYSEQGSVPVLGCGHGTFRVAENNCTV